MFSFIDSSLLKLLSRQEFFLWTVYKRIETGRTAVNQILIKCLPVWIIRRRMTSDFPIQTDIRKSVLFNCISRGHL